MSASLPLDSSAWACDSAACACSTAARGAADRAEVEILVMARLSVS